MGPKRNQVSYIKPNEPAFLRRIKQQAGYREGPDIDTKRDAYMDDSEENEDVDEKDDEKPTIVVLRSGDLTAEEATKEEIELKKKEEKELIEKGKIVFKPQKKRTAPLDQSASDDLSHNKKVKRDANSSEDDRKNPIKKSCLLSFDDDEDE